MKTVHTSLGAHVEAMAEDDGYVQALYGRDGKVERFVQRVPARGTAEEDDGKRVIEVGKFRKQHD